MPFCLKKKGKKLRLISSEEIRTIFLLSIRSRYTSEKMISMLKKIEAYIRLCMILPSCHINSSLRKYQKTAATSKINSEKIDDFIVFLLLILL